MTDEEFFEAFSVAINGILVTWFLNPDSIDLKPYGYKHLKHLLQFLEPPRGEPCRNGPES